MKIQRRKLKFELKRIENKLRVKEWRWQVAQIMTEIPPGYLATYGRIAEIANQRYELNIIARNAAWLRSHLYELLTHNTYLPLHRIAKCGDVSSLEDSKKTKSCNDKLREQEGSISDPQWYPHVADKKIALNKWSRWQSFPDPRVGGYLSAPFGPGVYELRIRSTSKMVLFGSSKNVADRMSSILPAPLGTGTRANFTKRRFVFNNIAEIEYRTMACPDEDAALVIEKQLRSSKKYLFPK